MRIMPLLKAACLSLMLSACVAPLLMMSPTSQLMWALLKPLVGLDPNEVNLLEQPMIKDRLSPLLGPHYDTTMQLLKTANELQQEGPLFYMVSRYAPVPDAAKQAGMVWNSQTNQMAVLLQHGDGTTQTFGEDLAANTPLLPVAMQGWQTPITPTTTSTKALTDAASKPLAAAPLSLGSALSNATRGITDSLAGSASQAISNVATKATSQAAHAATQGATDLTHTATTAIITPAKQVASDTASPATQVPTELAIKATAIPAKQVASDRLSPATKGKTELATKVATEAVTKAAAIRAKQVASDAVSPATQVTSGDTRSATEQAAKARAKAEAELEALLQ